MEEKLKEVEQMKIVLKKIKKKGKITYVLVIGSLVIFLASLFTKHPDKIASLFN